MVTEIILDKIVDAFIEQTKKELKDRDFRFEPKKTNLQESLSSHYQTILSWMNFVNFKELRSPKMLHNVYVDLDIQLTPRRWLPKDSREKTLLISDIVKRNFHAVILGDVGSGKTTTLQQICKKTIESEGNSFVDNKFPILVLLRNFEKSQTLIESLGLILGIHIHFSNSLSTEEKRTRDPELKDLRRNILFNYLEELKPIILIDGLDEIPLEQQRQIHRELNQIYQNLNATKIVLTCRSGAYDVALPNCEVFEICPLTDRQIKRFTLKWLDNDKFETASFLKQLKSSPFADTAIRPLTLAHLCALFKKYKKIPTQPKSIYKRIVNLLLEDWDTERGIPRNSSFSDFEPDRKLEFLYCFAYELTVVTGQKVFSEDTFLRIFDKIYINFSIPGIERKKIIKEIESETGLIIKSSYDHFEFAHASIQEYLTAEYIVRLPKVHEHDLYTKNLMNELAIAVCLSSNPTLYFASLVVETFPNSNLDNNKIESFIRRLAVENPEFSSDPLTAVGILFLFTNYFTPKKNARSQQSESIQPFQEFWESMLSKKMVQEAMLQINTIYDVSGKIDGLTTLQYNSMYGRTGFNFPSRLVIPTHLYDV